VSDKQTFLLSRIILLIKLDCAARSEFLLRAEPSESEGGLSEDMKKREGVASGSATPDFYLNHRF
jgi:hypothetical protein